MSDIKLLLLGAPGIERAGAPAEVDTRKALALLAYLVLGGQPQRRDTLAVLLWPDYDQARARGALRRTLSVLNKALGDSALAADRETVGGPALHALWADVSEFERLAATPAPTSSAACGAAIGALTRAAELYRGDFMAGFSLRDSPEFDDWQVFHAERLRRALAAALERLTGCHALLGDFAPALERARQWLALDPLREEAHRQLMRLYAWSGQRAAAIQQYRDCVRVLDQELGVPPLAETTQLYQEIREDRLPPAPAAAPPPSSSPAPMPAAAAVPAAPLVGRDTEWAALLAAYAAARERGQLIVLEGEAGIGKTRLAGELLRHARKRGAHALGGRCYEGESALAYGPFVDALRAALRAPDGPGRLAAVPARWLSELAHLLPELAALRPDLPPPAPLDAAGAQSRLFEAIGQALLALCGGAQPGIVFLDDLQWADAASLDLLAYLARRLRDQPLCLLLAWRSDETPPDHRGRAIAAESRRAGAATAFLLSRLGRDAVDALVQHAGQGRLSRQLFQETEGLPFFVIEYLAALANAGEHTPNEWAVPRGVRDLLHARLAVISETGAQVLAAAAVIGRSFDYDAVRAASGRDEEETIAALEQLLARGLIHELPAELPSYDFYHEKLRALVYGEITLARRRLLHRRVAATLHSRARTPAERDALAGRLAHHYQLAGQQAAAAEQFARAGEHARRVYANADALAHFGAALALGHPQPAALHEACGDMQTLLGEYRAAQRSYEAAAALHAPAELARVERKLADLCRRQGEWEQAESHLQAALAALGGADAGAERARLYAAWSLTAHRSGDAGRAGALATSALHEAERAADAPALIEAHNILGILASHANDLEAARAHLGRSLALAEQLGDDGGRAAALNNLALAERAAGATGHALALAERAAAIYQAQGDRHREAALRNTLADLLYDAGQSEAAMAQLKQAVAIFAQIGANAGAMQPEIWKLVEW